MVSDLPYRPCAGVMLLNPEGKVFAGQRIDTTGEAWQMPQGGVDPEEDARQAALRELEEETGITRDMVEVIAETPNWLSYDLPEHLIGRLWGGKYRGQRQKWFAMRFLGRDTDINIETSHPEFNQWKWVMPEQLPELIVPFKQDLYQEVLRQFRHVL